LPHKDDHRFSAAIIIMPLSEHISGRQKLAPHANRSISGSSSDDAYSQLITTVT